MFYTRFTLQTQTRYAQFNALTVTGRIFNAEVVPNNGQPFLSVSIISTASKDGADLVYTFNNSNGLLSLHEKGWFNQGRQVTITGHIHNVSEVYTAKSGEVRMRKRPEIHMTGVTVLDGGLGPMPDADKRASRPAGGSVISVGTPAEDLGTPQVDEAPSYGSESAKDEEGVPLF